MTAIELDRVEERTEEPAKAWNNKWRSPETRTWICDRCKKQGLSRYGEVEWDCCGPYPSKELCEHAAMLAIEYLERQNRQPDEYLGAFPVSP